MTFDEYFDSFLPSKLGAPLKSMGKFPVAKAKDILVDYDESKPEGLREIRLADLLKRMNVEKITKWDFASGLNNNIEIVSSENEGEGGITWENDDTEIEFENGTYRTNPGVSKHRVPIVAGNGIEFEKDSENNIVKINAAGGGVGGCIIDVDIELPAEGINDKVIYRVSRDYQADVFRIEDGRKIPLSDWLEMRGGSVGMTFNIKVVKQLPEVLKESVFGSYCTAYVYVVWSTGIGYCDIGGTGARTLGQCIHGDSGIEFDKGWLTNENGNGYYFENKGATHITYHAHKNGGWTEFAKAENKVIQIVETEEEMEEILNNATEETKENYYQYMGPTGPAFRHGGIYKVTQEVKD